VGEGVPAILHCPVVAVENFNGENEMLLRRVTMFVDIMNRLSLAKTLPSSTLSYHKIK